MNQKILLSTAYLAPIQYFSKLLKYDEVYIEAFENFSKQTYRNRCKIYGANGILQLSIPVKKTSTKILIRDLQIDYDTAWQKLHWKSIESAYRSSPFFEYYSDDFLPFYTKTSKYLLDFNSKIQNVILDLLDESPSINYTQDYIGKTDDEMNDFRNLIHPKKELNDPEFKIAEYNQVFSEKYGFIENLSIIDLLFNEGPNSINLIEL